MTRPQTIKQAIARGERPEFATVEGRVADEVKRTVFELAQGKVPKTALGVLMMGHVYSDRVEDSGLTTAAIATRAGLNPFDTNHRGDQIDDVMEDLVETGWVERIGDIGPLEQSWEQINPFVRYRLIEVE